MWQIPSLYGELLLQRSNHSPKLYKKNLKAISFVGVILNVVTSM